MTCEVLRLKEGRGQPFIVAEFSAANTYPGETPAAYDDGWVGECHLNYEQIEPHKLDWIESPSEPLSYRVEKMKLSKDKTSLRVNDSLTLGGIPPAVFDYRLGNRSALDWVIDQYRAKTDKRSGISSDPNRRDDPQYIVRRPSQPDAPRQAGGHTAADN